LLPLSFFTATPTPYIYTLSLHDALPIFRCGPSTPPAHPALESAAPNWGDSCRPRRRRRGAPALAPRGRTTPQRTWTAEGDEAWRSEERRVGKEWRYGGAPY